MGDMFDYATAHYTAGGAESDSRFMMPDSTFSSILSISPNLWPSTARWIKSGRSALHRRFAMLVQHSASYVVISCSAAPDMAV